MTVPAEYKTELRPIWCPGCGDFGVLAAFAQAFAELDVPTKDIVLVTGIGCSSRLAGYLKVYGFNAIHGRTLPIATGIKLANPELTVIAAGGDGDGYSIGIGHIPHAARRNVDITYLVMDNGIYGLTKGQQSPTSPVGIYSSSSPYGTYERPLNPVEFLLSIGVSFVAQGFSGDTKHLTTLIKRAIMHRGFAVINCISPCPTYRGGMQLFKEIRAKVRNVDEIERDLSDRSEAFRIAHTSDFIPVGVIYEDTQIEDYQSILEGLRAKAKEERQEKLEDILETFKA